MTTMQTYTDTTEGPGVAHGLNYKKLHRFTLRLANSSGSEAERLRAENARLNRELVTAELEHAIASNRILPRDRETFQRHFSNTATLNDVRRFIAQTPRPMLTFAQQPRSPVRVRQPEADVGSELAQRVAELRAKNPGMDFLAAQMQVLRDDPALAETYRHAPGST